jgi:hypothetical protein
MLRTLLSVDTLILEGLAVLTTAAWGIWILSPALSPTSITWRAFNVVVPPPVWAAAFLGAAGSYALARWRHWGWGRGAGPLCCAALWVYQCVVGAFFVPPLPALPLYLSQAVGWTWIFVHLQWQARRAR